MNVAVTVWSPFMSTTQEPVPAQAPPHPSNVEPVGVAVSRTEVPLANTALQSLPQSIPAGALVTLPLPVLETERRAPFGVAVNSAVTDRLPFI